MNKEPVGEDARSVRPEQRVSLKMLANHLDLSPSTVSFVLNDSPGRSIPEATRKRVREAAIRFNYQPSLIARSLQGKRMQSVGVLLPELGEGYHSQVLSGVGDMLIRRGYFYFTVHHRHKKDLVRAYPELLQSRGVDAIVAIDTHLEEALPLPTVTVAGHTEIPGVTNVVLNHEMAAELSVRHLFEMGHRRIVFMKGQPFSSDSEVRWAALMKVARELGLETDPALTIELQKDSNSPEMSFPGIQGLLHGGRKFSAILCFNDVSALGCIRALHDVGIRVPQDVSILGFDDIQSASYQVPSLTTIRQPLQRMGEIAADLLLRKLGGEELPGTVVVDPELVVRESTAHLAAETRRSRPGESAKFREMSVAAG